MQITRGLKTVVYKSGFCERVSPEKVVAKARYIRVPQAWAAIRRRTEQLEHVATLAI